MWIVYHKPSKTIAGLTANAERDIDKDAAVNEVVQGLVAKKDIREYDAILVQDRDKAAVFMAAFPRKLLLAEGEGGLRPVIREPESFRLHITCDAPNRHPVDRIAVIPGDGTSFTTISLQKVDERNKMQRADTDNETLYLRSDHGSIRDVTGEREINSIQLRNGKAVIRLVSEPIKRVATVQILSADPGLPSSSYRVEFA